MPQLRSFLEMLKTHWWLGVLFAVIFVLRIPNFSEPYWYGDEAIYLTVGNGLKDGQILYRDIIDHKTPLIYYFAMVPNQWWFRLVLLGWMLAATALFYEFSIKLLKSPWLSRVASLIFVLLTTLPWFEGHIPNGELFVIGFVMAGFYLLAQTSYFSALISNTPPVQRKHDWITLSAAGFFFGLGTLVKVPGVFDFAAAAFLLWLVAVQKLASQKFSIQSLFSAAVHLLQPVLLLTLGWASSIALSAAYFAAVGAGADYLQYGLLYNFHYSGTWQHEFPLAWLNTVFTLPGKAGIAAVLLLAVSVPMLRLKPAFRFAAGWFALSLFAALLSNRPYPHYFMQLVPSFSLLVVLMADALFTLRENILKPTYPWSTVGMPLAMGTLLIGLSLSVLILLGFRPYSTAEYYSKYWKLISGSLDQQSYSNSFHWLIAENTQVTKTIHALGEKSLFIWGTNPMLYAQSGTYPVGRFTVSFHIQDLKAYDETMRSLRQAEPRLIVVMHDEHGEFPEFSEYLRENYMPNHQLQHMTLYLRIQRTPEGKP